MKALWPRPGARVLSVAVSVLLLLAALWFAGPEDMWRSFARFPVWALVGVLGLLAANLVLVSFRLWRMLAHFGAPMSWAAASRASISGHLAGMFVMSLFGQVVGRQAALRKSAVQPAVVASITAYERAVLLVIGAALCLLGASVLLGKPVVGAFLHSLSLTEIAVTAITGLGLSLLLARSRYEAQLLTRFRSWWVILRFSEITGITLISQALMLSVFVVGMLAIEPGIPILALFAAAAVISFAASMPISVNGWGIREMTAVYVFGKFGVAAADAIAVSVLVGVCSMIVILLAAVFGLKKSTRTAPGPGATPQPGATVKADLEKASAWILAMAMAVLVFFQMHVSFPGPQQWVVNLNLADPFAILALAVVVFEIFLARRLPAWRERRLNVAIAGMSAMLLLAFIRGISEIGVTQWALAGRVFGWLVLLGYLSAGYLMVRHAGGQGLRRFTETLVATGAAVVIVQVLVRILDQAGWNTGFRITLNFEGYAANRNAFAFQLLVSSAMVIAYSGLHASLYASKRTFGRIRAPFILQSHLFAMTHGIVLAGLVLTGSRAGLITGIIMLFAAWVFKFTDRRMLALSVLFAAMFWGVFVAMSEALLSGVLQSQFSTGASNAERWESIVRGWDMWLQSPLLGAGLGVFIEQSTLWHGQPIVIHSTPLWILAEFGIVGAAVFGWAFVVIGGWAFKPGSKLPARRLAFCLILAFAIFGLAHEILYQRIFWLALGAAMAYPGRQAS